MKNSKYTSSAIVLGSLCLVLLSTSGCRKNEPLKDTGKSKAAELAEGESALAPLEPQGSFNEVMGLLDEGGGLLVYLGTDQLYAKLAEKIGDVETLVQNLNPDAQTDDGRAEVKKMFGIVTEALKRSGLSEITGFGISGIEIEQGIFRSRMVLHHFADKGDGYFWDFLGKEPHAPIGLDLMPANTVLAGGQDLDLSAVWYALNKEAQAMGNAEFSASLADIPASFKKATQLDFDAFLKSLGGHYGFALTLDESTKVSIPTDDEESLELPRPDLLLFAKVSDKLLFDHLSQLAKAIPGTVVTNLNGLDQIQFPALYPPIPSLKPIIAFDGEQILICSSPEMLAASLAVKSGEQLGFASTDGFKKLSALAAPKGNGFSYADHRLQQTVIEIQKSMMEAMPPEAKRMQDLMDKLGSPGDSYGVFANTDQGWDWTGVGTHDTAGMFLVTSVVAPVAVVAGMMLPALSKTKAKASRIKCVNHMKQICLGLKIYASDNEDRFPFQIPKDEGGTLEMTKQDGRGDDTDPFRFMLLLKNELGTPAILTCPAAEGVERVRSWGEFKRKHLSYKFRSGKEVDETRPAEALLWCPIHHNVALVDGSVMQMTEADTKARGPGSWKPTSKPAPPTER